MVACDRVHLTHNRYTSSLREPLHTILLVEDDERLGAQVVEHLRRDGFDTRWIKNGTEAIAHDKDAYSLVILDLMLPGAHGLDVLKQLRSTYDVPVLVLSARNETHDKVRALKLGADDFVTKPFWPDELLARVRARLRRPTLQRKGRIEMGPLIVDLEGRKLAVDGELVSLTPIEFDLLAALASRAGTAIPRSWLADHVLDPNREGTERTLDVHMSRLRKKLGEHASCIATVWGVGYRLEFPN